jgi:tripartite-type tricarboxylate transporter receptor subunit TctC
MLKLPRRNFLRLAAGATALPAMARLARADSYPSRPVRLVVGFPPAGTTDIGARLMAQWLSDHLGQQFIVENRPGGGSSIAADYVVRSPADGYTLLLSTVANAINTSFYQNLSFDFARDVAAVGNLFRVPLVMEINPALPVKTVAEFIAYAKANPGKITLASAGTGTSGHISAELFAMMAGIKMVHVPYRGAGPALVDVIGGQCQVIFDLLPSSIGYVRAGSTRALAVTTTARSEALPDIPVLADFMPGYEASA